MRPEPRSALLDLLRSLEDLNGHAERHPLDYLRWTQPQINYLRRIDRRKLFRTGNRVGKSRVALADVVFRARKAHPYRPDLNARRGPVHQWVVGVSWDQLIPHMRTMKGLLGADELRSAPNFTFRKGWGKDSPCLEWRNGSSVTWKTTEQDERAHAGAKLDHALIDEPCMAETYREMDRRVSDSAGDVSIVLTPINAPEPLDWLQELCAERIVYDLHARMTPDVFRFADTGELRQLPDGTVLDEVWIAQQEREVLARWRDIVLHGEWNETSNEGTFARVFDPRVGGMHVSDFLLDGSEVLAIGFDHGTQAFTETAVLLAVDERGEYPAVYIVDVYEAPENSPPEEDARAIVAMLARHTWRGKPITWRDLKFATGDIAHHGGRGKIGRKSNAELDYELRKALKNERRQPLVPAIWTAKTGKGSDPRGSLRRGLEWVHRTMRRPGHFTVHPRCKSLIEGLPLYKGGSEDENGHLLDGVRYGLDPWIRRTQGRDTTAPTVRIG